VINDRADLIDDLRSCCLCDVGQPAYIAVTAVAADGSSHLLLAEAGFVGDESVTYDPTCAAVAHEQLGPLPLGVVRRITIAQRTHRCGRRTKAGAPCRTPVAHPGDACSWHRTELRR
jgi:hypothetical protein